MMFSSRPILVGVLLIPGYSLMSVSSVTEPLRGANRAAGQPAFDIRFLSSYGAAVASSSGFEVKTVSLSSQIGVAYDLLIVCGGHEDERYFDRKLVEYLRQSARRRTTIGGVSTGSFVLAAAGLLDGRRCTTHWSYLEAFRESFPQLDICDELFVMDRRIFTCAGGIAALDAMLDIIRSTRGHELANRAAENFVYSGVRRSNDSQRMSLRLRLGTAEPAILEAVGLMEKNLENPLRLPDLAMTVGISSRQLERLFRDHLNCSPVQFYVRLRLQMAQRLLRHSAMPVAEIAIACGFTSASHFSRAYRAAFETCPTSDRARLGVDQSPPPIGARYGEADILEM